MFMYFHSIIFIVHSTYLYVECMVSSTFSKRAKWSEKVAQRVQNCLQMFEVIKFGEFWW